MEPFLNSLKVAATSPLAVVAYVCVVAAWITRIWLVTGPKQRAEHILSKFTDDATRSTALRELLGADPPKGIQKSDIMDWVRIKSSENTRGYLALAYLATLLAIVVIVGMAMYTWYTGYPVRLIGESVTSGG